MGTYFCKSCGTVISEAELVAQYDRLGDAGFPNWRICDLIPRCAECVSEALRLGDIHDAMSAFSSFVPRRMTESTALDQTITWAFPPGDEGEGEDQNHRDDGGREENGSEDEGRDGTEDGQ